MHRFVQYRYLVCIVVLASLWIMVGLLQAQEPIANEQDPIGHLFTGQPAIPQPITSSEIPQHPFMGANGSSNMHNNAYMTDTYTIAGPLGNNLEVITSSLGGLCPTLTFDSHGRIIGACLNLSSASLFLVDSVTLTPLATLPLPVGELEGLGDFTSGSYFYLDQQDHAFVPTIEGTIWEVAVVGEGDSVAFEVVKIYDLTSVLVGDDKIGSVLPDFNGLLWFVTRQGTVGIFDPATGAIEVATLEGELSTNSFAVDETGGAFIVSDHAMYRFDADESGQPAVTWREEYDRGTRQKTGQVSQGSGTTPTLMGSDYVTISDNADPQMHVLVYQRGVEAEGERLVCAEPVFDEMESSNENSLIATDTSIIIENNYGYSRPLRALEATAGKIGMTRVDLDPDGGCHTVWTNHEVIPSVVSKLSLATGLIYTYTKDESIASGIWSFAAVDFYTGETVYKLEVGNGLNYNNHYAGLYLGPDGTAYVGVIDGLVAIRDGVSQ